MHAYFTDQFREIVDRLQLNSTRPDLFVSVGHASAVDEARSVLAEYPGRVVAVEEVPNAGRDVGPLLTQFGPILVGEYDVVGHIHIKKSRQLENPKFVTAWSNFLLENLLGGSAGGGMVDLILNRMRATKKSALSSLTIRISLDGLEISISVKGWRG